MNSFSKIMLLTFFIASSVQAGAAETKKHSPHKTAKPAPQNTESRRDEHRTRGDTKTPSTRAKDPYIIGGQSVADKNWIAQTVVALVAQLTDGSQALCTASIVAPDLAVTAAHCVTPPPGGMGKVAGLTLVFSRNLKGLNPTLLRKIDHVEVPREWSPSSTRERDTSDVALVHFQGGLVTGYTSSDLLPFDQKLERGEKVELAGYGISNATADKGAGTLRHRSVDILDPNYSPSEVQLDQSHGGGACHGDSGGPAYVVIEGHPYLFGITSRGTGNCDQDVIYTRLAAYDSWFRSAVKILRK